MFADNRREIRNNYVHVSCQQSHEAEDEEWNLTECMEGMRRCKRGGELNYNNGEEEMDWSGQEENWRDQRFSTGTMKGGKKGSLIQPHTAFPSFSFNFAVSAHSVHLHLHYTQPELIWWRVMNGGVLMLFIESGSGG